MNVPQSDTRSVAEKVVAGTVWVVAWRLATRNLGLVSTLVLVRLLGPADFGLVALATGFAATVEALSAIGVQDALVREPSPGRDMYDSAFTLNAIRGIATAAIIAAIAWPTTEFFGEPRLVAVMFALAAVMLVSAFENIGVVDFRRRLAFRAEFNLQFYSRLAGVVATISTALLWHSYWALVTGILTTRLARFVQSYTMSAYRPRLTLNAWRRLIGFSLWTWCLAMILQARDRIDSIVIGRLLGTAQIGVFMIGTEFGSLPVTEVVEPLSRTLFSGFALQNQSSTDPIKLYLDAIEATFLLVLPAGIGISMVADPMVRLVLGVQWLSAVPIIQIIAIASPITVFGNFGNALLSAGGQPRTTFLLCIAATVIRVPLMMFAVHAWSLQGAAITVAIAWMIDQAMFIWYTARKHQFPLAELLARLWRASSASVVMITCLGILGMAWTRTNAGSGFAIVMDLATRCGIGALAYVGALSFVWYLADRPDGAEQKILDAVRRVLTRRRASIQTETENGSL